MQVQSTPLAALYARSLRENRDELVLRWLNRITDRVAVEPDRVFPPPDLIDHVPLMIQGIADYLEDPAEEISVDTPAVAKAMELGSLRHTQGFPVRQILWEYEILGGVLYDFLGGVDVTAAGPVPPEEVMDTAHRVFRAISVVERATALHYLRQAAQVTDDREQRLRGFGRALSHELKNALSVVLGAATMLQEDFVLAERDDVVHFANLVLRNARQMKATMENLIELARLDLDARQERNVLLPHIADEVARQLRAFAESHEVSIRIAADCPAVHVPAGVVELCLSNLLSNSIKYHDPAQDDRWVEVRAWLEMESSEDGHIVIEIKDNGRGVPEHARPRLFERFFRAEGSDGIEGAGLGLSLVRDALRTVGGTIFADFPASGGAIFRVTLPGRRQEDAVAAEATGQGT